MSITTSVIIVNFNTATITTNCVKSILSHANLDEVEVIVVDNGSSDNSVVMLKSFGDNIHLIQNDENLGFSGGNNVGLRVAQGDFLLLLNSDTLVEHDVVGELADFLRKNQFVSAVSPMLLNEDSSLQKSHYNFPKITKSLAHLSGVTRLLRATIPQLRSQYSVKTLELRRPFAVDYCIFAAVMIRRKVFDEIGLLDEELFFYHEDCEFGLRMAKAGHRFFYLPSQSLKHLGGASSSLVRPMAFKNFFLGLSVVYRKHYSFRYSYTFHFFALPILVARFLLCFIPGISFSGPPSDYLNSDVIKVESVNPKGALRNLIVHFSSFVFGSFRFLR